MQPSVISTRNQPAPLDWQATQAARSLLTVVDPTRDLRWAELMTRHPRHSVFFLPAWARILSESCGYTPFYLTSTTLGGASSCIPIMEVPGFTGRRGVALPFSDECGPLVADPGAGKDLMEKILELGHARCWRTLEVRGGGVHLGANRTSSTYYGHALNLDSGDGALFKRFNSSVRTAIRKAEMAHVAVEVSASPQAVAEFYRLYCMTRRRHGVPAQPLAFFEAIQRHLLAARMGFVVLAKVRGVGAAAALFLNNDQNAIFKYGASDERFQNTRAGNLVMWTGIQQCIRRGAQCLNFGRTSRANEGLRRFKLGWGTDEYLIEYARYDFGKSRFVPGKDPAVGWYNPLFRAAPVWFTRLAGRLFLKHWG
jgi:hypothetical protein